MGNWGENGSARPTTKEYRDNWDSIFKKDKEEDVKQKQEEILDAKCDLYKEAQDLSRKTNKKKEKKT